MRNAVALGVCAILGGILIRRLGPVVAAMALTSAPPSPRAVTAAGETRPSMPATDPAAPLASAALGPEHGLLEITTLPDAPVSVDGFARGRGPRVTVALAAGYHLVRIRGVGQGEPKATGAADEPAKNGVEGKARLLQVPSGKTTRVDLTDLAMVTPK